MKTPPVSLLLADDGFDNYAQTVFGLTPWIKAHREAVRRFVAATAEGYRQCIAGDAPGAMKLVLAQNPEHGEALYRFKLAKMRALHMVDGGDAARLGVGAMTDARWASFFHTMAGAGLYPANMDYHKAYTLEFVRSQ
jgi:NitT/TauT family transport system substrate-binding protein